MSELPLVSVLTPSFNQGAWLSDNLASVAVQTYEHLEHIIMDAGSTDDTARILENVTDPRVRSTVEADRGQSHALNKALAKSRGDVIGWLNSDDAYFTPFAVADAVEVLRARPDVDIVYGHAVLTASDGLILQIIWVPPFNRHLLQLHDFILQPSVFVRRSALEQGFVDEQFHHAMDWELWLRLAAKHRFHRLDKVLAIDREHPARKSATPSAFAEDVTHLRRTYGLYSGGLFAVARKLVKISLRLAGTTTLPAARREPLAFQGRWDGPARSFLRQIAVPRSRMLGPTKSPVTIP